MSEVIERKRRFLLLVLTAILLAVICGISLYLRIALPYDHVFVNDAVWFRETDAYYHMRHIENLLHHFPHMNSFDPYMLYPGGGGGPSRPFFDWLVAAIILILSFGSPTQHLIDVVGAYMPAILGTLTLIPVYFIGKELFNRWVGIIAAALLAILPSEFLHRSLLGFTDHHVAEVLFSTTFVLFLIMALKRAREREISFAHLLSKNWSTLGKPMIYSLLAGIFLGIYLLSWVGGLMFVFIAFAYFVIQFIVDHLRGKPTDYLCLVAVPPFFIAFIILVSALGPGSLGIIFCAAMTIAVLTPIALSLLSTFMSSKAIKPAFYPLALVGLAGITIGLLYLAAPSLLPSMLSQFSIFAPSRAARTILEVQALNPGVAWRNFTTSFLFSLVSLGLLTYAAIKEKKAEINLLLVWSVVMLVALFAQRRFGYYFAVNVSLLTGYFCWKALETAGVNQLLAGRKEKIKVVKKVKKGEKAEQIRVKVSRYPRSLLAKVSITGIVVLFVVFFPNIGYAKGLANSPGLMTSGWYSACVWLKDNTPEPFGDPDFYYALYPPPEQFEYPDTVYGVMSWWDYGYFIMRIGHRVPISNPGQAQAAEAGRFFITQNESAANELADQFKVKYVMIDHAMPTTKFYAMPEWAGGNVSEFYEVYYQRAEAGRLQPVLFYYPAYYQTMVARLYNFDAKAVVPTQSLVLSYEEKTIDWLGIRYKEIVGTKSFPDFASAQAYIASQESGNYRIVGTNPLVSPVPLEELKTYRLVYQSDAKAKIGDSYVPSVKIFEYLGSSQ